MSKILSLINSIIPKRNRIIFSSFPDISGNAIALYNYIVNKRKDIAEQYHLIWTVTSMDIGKAKALLQRLTGKKQHIVLRKKSIRGIFSFFSSKYIVSTHGYFPGVRTAKGQSHLNLWHGMPFKRIGRMLETVHSNGKMDEADYAIATSTVFQTIMAKSFGIPVERVFVTGQPVNDVLLSETNSLHELDIKKSDYKNIIVWLPTYRKSVVGDIREDGKVNSLGVASILNEHYQDLQEHLATKQYLLLIKPHPMDAICQMKLPESSNIKVISNTELEKAGIQLYELLSQSDVLFTDYSSVFIDYLATGKPIAFVCDDIDEYANSRGFCFDPPKEYMPGQIITDYDELIEYLDHMESKNQNWKAEYRHVQSLFNPLTDSFACQRVCKEIWGNQEQ